MSTETETHPKLTTLSQLMRLLAEQGISDAKLNALFTAGILARVFQTQNPGQVNLKALERVLGFPEEKTPTFYSISTDRKKTLEQLIRTTCAVTEDNRHMELTRQIEDRKESLSMGLTYMERIPRWGQIHKRQEAEGVRPADLYDLLFFACEMNLERTVGSAPIYALAARIKGEKPRVFRLQQPVGSVYPCLTHVNSYESFPMNAQFLGVKIQ